MGKKKERGNLMARGRMIDKVIILSRKINAISEGAENLYYRIYVNTDDFGLFHADPEILKGQIYTLRKDITIEIIQKRLYELVEIDLIKIYKNNDETYLEIVDFEKHQTFRKDYTRKYDYPKPSTKSYESVQNHTESLSNINEIKLKETKLKEDTKTTETLILLSKVKNYPYDAEKDLEFIKSLIVDFPDVDVIEKIKQIMLNWLNFPLKKKSRPRVQIRRWVTNESKWQKEGDKSRDVGKSYMKEDLEVLPMELLNRIYKVISAKGESIEKFYDKAKLVFPKIEAQWEKSDKKPETFIKLVEGT